MVLLVLLVLGMVLPSALAQEDAEPLYQREAFDRVTLDDANKRARLEVYPISSLDHTNPPSEVKGTVRIRRLQDPPEQLYDINGVNISKIELFPFLLLDEANRLLAKNQVDDAFFYIERLTNDFPKTPGLKQLEEDFYYRDAGFLFSQKRYDESLLSLNQVYRLNPQRSGLAGVLDRVLSQIIQAEFKAKKFGSVRAKLEFAKSKYGRATKKTVDSWERRLQARAGQELNAAKSAFAAGKPTEALAAIRRANEAWKNLPGTQKLRRSIMAEYPRLRVAVTQRYSSPTEFDATRYELNWSARRVMPLLAHGLVEFKEFTSDGGVYASPIAKLKVSSDRRQLDLQLDAKRQGSAHDLSRTLLQLASPTSEAFSPRWAEYLKSVYVPNANQLQVTLNRPSLLPESLLPRASVEFGVPGELVIGQAETANVQTFQVRTGGASQPIREIAETFYADPGAATDALLAGEVDLIDRVYPPDLANLKSQANLKLLPYRLPTVHALVFNDREPLMRDATFRRSLLYAINREEFVRTEINAGITPPVARVLSGLAPIGRNRNDPLSYAYDQDIEPRSFDPSLAVVLLRLAIAQKKAAEAPDDEAQQPPPGEAPSENETSEEETAEGDSQIDDEPTLQEQLPALVLAHSDSPMATAACESIATDWRRVGMNITLRPLESGRGWPSDRAWDICYVETTIEEPLADLPNLVLNHGILGRHGGLVWHATRSLQEASDLEEARRQFGRMHQLTYSHTPLIPLWQIVEHAAVRSSVSGPSNPLISLYRNVTGWRLAP